MEHSRLVATNRAVVCPIYCKLMSDLFLAMADKMRRRLDVLAIDRHSKTVASFGVVVSADDVAIVEMSMLDFHFHSVH